MTCDRFGLIPFRSPLLRESKFLSFPGVTEMCHFTPSRCARPMHSGGRVRPTPDWLPYRRSPDIVLASSFPGLFAGCHVLHHLLAPRHPPCTLGSLTAVVPPTRSKHGWFQMPLFSARSIFKDRPRAPRLVETTGLEPATPSLQSWCSPIELRPLSLSRAWWA